jgi:hypothetical protein
MCGSTGGRATATQTDRTKQFAYINRTARGYLQDGDPVVALGTKATEFVQPEVRLAPNESITRNEALEVWRLASEWTGKIDEDAASFAACAIRRWWHVSGRRTYQRSARLMIAVDLGNAVHLQQPDSAWRRDLQVFSDEYRLLLTICHVPAGTSKWAASRLPLVMCACHSRHDTSVAHQVVIHEIMLPSVTEPESSGMRDFDLEIEWPDAYSANGAARQNQLSGQWNYSIAPRVPGS